MVIPVLSLTSVLSALFSLQEVLCYRCGIRLNQQISGLKEAKASSHGVTQWQNLFLTEFMEAKNLDRLKNTVDRNKEENSTHYN